MQYEHCMSLLVFSVPFNHFFIVPTTKTLTSPMTGSPEAPKDTRDVFGATFNEIHGSTYLERDAHGLARLGKSQVLKVRMFSILHLYFIALQCWVPDGYC